MPDEPCPNCEGWCCRTDSGMTVEHRVGRYTRHTCPDCEEGVVPTPEPAWTAADERAAIVAYLREAANAPPPIERGVPSRSPAGRGLLLLHADRIEHAEHLREEVP